MKLDLDINGSLASIVQVIKENREKVKEKAPKYVVLLR